MRTDRIVICVCMSTGSDRYALAQVNLQGVSLSPEVG